MTRSRSGSATPAPARVRASPSSSGSSGSPRSAARRTTSAGSIAEDSFVAACIASLGSRSQGVEQGSDRPALQIGERAQGREADPLVACRIEDRPRQPIDDGRAPRAPEKDARRRRGGGSDCRVRSIDRVEHTVERTRIGDRLEGAERRRACTGEGASDVEQQEQPIDCPRADQCEPRDRRFARGRAVGAEIGGERLDLAG